ncbi:MAG: Uma2 family endonuclease [Dehalococcoidia bacterium]|nr:Uma2 family endonuclease [Dehalococcoidia bacterium]
MVTRTTPAKELIYGIAPVPIDPDDMPDRIPIELIQAPTIEQLPFFLNIYLEGLGEDVAALLMLSNIPIRYDPLNRRLFVAPDIYIAFDVDVAAIREKTSYNVWEVGKPPEFALEVASPSTYQRDLYEKPEIYERIGVGEYWMFDPTGGNLYGQSLTGFRLVAGIYEPIDIVPNEHGLESGYSEVLRLRLCSLERSRHSELAAVQPNLEIRDDHNPVQMLVQDPKTGEYLLNDRGLLARTRQAEARAERAEEQTEQAGAEVERLRERLRQLEQSE